MIRRWSATEKLATLSKKSFGSGNPSPWGQSEPNRIRSTGKCRRELVDALLDERRHPAVLDELVLRVALVLAPVAQVLEGLQQRRHPRAAVLDVGDLQPREPLEQPVRHEDVGEVVDDPVLHERTEHRTATHHPHVVAGAGGLRCSRTHPTPGPAACTCRRRCCRSRRATTRRRPTPGRDPRSGRRSDRPASAGRRP